MERTERKQRKYEYDKKWQSEHRDVVRMRNNNFYLKKKIQREKEFGMQGRCAMGRKYELIALDMLDGAIDCNVNSFHGKYDIVWNNQKIDVKSTRWDKRKKVWRFILSNTSFQDALLLFCLDNNGSDEINKILLIPTSSLTGRRREISIGKKSKYDIYLIQSINN